MAARKQMLPGGLFYSGFLIIINTNCVQRILARGAARKGQAEKTGKTLEKAREKRM